MNTDLYRNNMSYFKRSSPEIFNQYKDYQPTELCLHSNIDGYANLVNLTHNNHPVYKGDPVSFCEKQVNHFIQHPRLSSVQYKPSPITNKKHLHVPSINTLIEDTQKYADTSQAHCNAPIGLLMVNGCGLGYHIPLLLEKLDIYNLVVFEPHTDAFYASLHTIDWAHIVHTLNQNGRSLQLLIGTTPQNAIIALQANIRNIGLHNAINTFYYTHLNSGPAQEFTDIYKKVFHINASGVGFFDDEQVGLAHTIANLSRKTCVFREDYRDRKLPPIFVIANGPSLDDHIDFIKHNLNNVIVLSCGTALTSLSKAGIKPDFHVEMERNICIKEWIEAGTSAQYRKNITLLTLNTTAPEVLDLFGSYCIAKKPNDIGETLIDESLSGVKVEPLHLCNPTVANAGLSFSLAMGFKNIYLLGTDLGIKESGKHHSKLSIYYDLERSTNTTGHSGFEQSDSNYYIQANFGGEISTNHFLNCSRINMQHLLQHYKKISEDINCYNMNDGALIVGAQPTKPKNITQPFSPIDKPSIIDSIKTYHFVRSFKNSYNSKAVAIQQLSYLPQLKEQLSLSKEVHNPTDVYRSLSKVYSNINTLKNLPILKLLFIGSINEYLSSIIKVTLFQHDTKIMKEAYQIGYNIYMQFLDDAFDFMDKRPFELDDTYDDINQKLAGNHLSSEE